MMIPDGSMEDLDGKWILAKDTACPEKDASPATLGLPNMAGRHSQQSRLFLFSFSAELITKYFL